MRAEIIAFKKPIGSLEQHHNEKADFLVTVSSGATIQKTHTQKENKILISEECMGRGSKVTVALCNNGDNLVTFTGKAALKTNLSQ